MLWWSTAVCYVCKRVYVNFAERSIYPIYLICEVKEDVMYGTYKCVEYG